MAGILEIRWHARGGQGAKTASLLLAQAASMEGKYSQGFPDYGPERMGAPMRGFTRISDEPIKVHCAIYSPQIVVVLDDTLLKAVDVTAGTPEDGVIIVNTVKPATEVRELLKLKGRKVFMVDATGIAIEEIGTTDPERADARRPHQGDRHPVARHGADRDQEEVLPRLPAGSAGGERARDQPGARGGEPGMSEKSWTEIPLGGIIEEAGNAEPTRPVPGGRTDPSGTRTRASTACAAGSRVPTRPSCSRTARSTGSTTTTARDAASVRSSAPSTRSRSR